MDVHTGAHVWQQVFDATEWALITSLSVDDGDSTVTVAGTFSGTLRLGNAVVSSGGKTDGFIARLNAHGAVAWLRRIGGPGADTISAIAARGDVIAIAGSIASGAEFAGHPVEPRDARSPFNDGFVAALGVKGDYKWSQTFGGRGDDTVVGVAIDAAHHIAVASTIGEPVRIGTHAVAPKGSSAGLVVFWSPKGELGPIARLDASESIRLSSIAAAGGGVAVGGVFRGTLETAGNSMSAMGEDAFLASIPHSGNVSAAWHLAGRGREEIVSLNQIRKGFLAGVAYTDDLAAGADRVHPIGQPFTGAAIVTRPAGGL